MDTSSRPHMCGTKTKLKNRKKKKSIILAFSRLSLKSFLIRCQFYFFNIFVTLNITRVVIIFDIKNT